MAGITQLEGEPTSPGKGDDSPGSWSHSLGGTPLEGDQIENEEGNDLQEFENAIEQLNAENEALKKQVEDSNAESEILKRQLQNLTSKSEQDKQTIDQMLGGLTQARRDINNLQNVEQSKAGHITALQEQLRDAAGKISTLEDDGRGYCQSISVLENEISTLQSQIKGREEVCNSLVNDTIKKVKQTLQHCRMLDDLIRPEITCKYCFEILNEPQVLFPCGHTFCDTCIDQMESKLSGLVVCSLCQAQVPRVDVCGNLALAQLCPRYTWWAEPIKLLKDTLREVNEMQDKLFKPGAEQARQVVAESEAVEGFKVLRRIANAVKRSGTQIIELFERFDEDESGTIDKEELIHGLQSIRVFLSQAELATLLQQADPNKSGHIEYAAFALLVNKSMQLHETHRRSIAIVSEEVDNDADIVRAKGY